MKEKTGRNRSRKSANFAWFLTLVITLVMILAVISPPLIAQIVWYNNTMNEMKEEMESYSPYTYEYLLGAISSIFKENENIIDINSKPEDIQIKILEKQDDKFICELRLNNEETNKYYPVASIYVELSNDFKILSTTSNYSSQEEFVEAFKNNIKKEASNIKIEVLGIEVLISMLLAIIYYWREIFQLKK